MDNNSEDSIRFQDDLENFDYDPQRNSLTIGGRQVKILEVDSDTEYYLKNTNVDTLKLLACVQALAALGIFLFQILLTGAASGKYKPIDWFASGIWAPVFIYSIASGLTWLSTKTPSICILGTGLTLQIGNTLLSAIQSILAVVSIMLHGDTTNYDPSVYDPEVAGRVYCSFMILSTTIVFITSIFICVHLSRTLGCCCSRRREVIASKVMFDVVTRI